MNNVLVFIDRNGRIQTDITAEARKLCADDKSADNLTMRSGPIVCSTESHESWRKLAAEYRGKAADIEAKLALETKLETLKLQVKEVPRSEVETAHLRSKHFKEGDASDGRSFDPKGQGFIQVKLDEDTEFKLGDRVLIKDTSFPCPFYDQSWKNKSNNPIIGMIGTIKNLEINEGFASSVIVLDNGEYAYIKLCDLLIVTHVSIFSVVVTEGEMTSGETFNSSQDAAAKIVESFNRNCAIKVTFPCMKKHHPSLIMHVVGKCVTTRIRSCSGDIPESELFDAWNKSVVRTSATKQDIVAILEDAFITALKS
jgi:hypothetical protein